MRKKAIIIAFALAPFFGLYNVSAQSKDQVLLSVDGQKTTVEEFERVFKKNNRDSVISRKALEEYLGLYINFKLKVRDAEKSGLDTLQKFKDELAGYRKQLAQPYLTDNATTENLIKEAYERMKTDINASHILIKCEDDALPKDTLAAYNQAIKVRERIIKGEDFGKVAMEVSTDPSAKSNGGNLGYFNVLQMVYPFESAAYTLKKGEVSMPVRTRFGYHIIQVNDRRANQGELLTAHIMIRYEGKDEAAQKKINELYDSLKAGADFANLAKKYSDDKGSATNGGQLPWFSAGGIVKEFEENAFALKNNGDVSKPFKTAFGWHVVKRIDHKPMESYDKMYNSLKAKIARDSRSQMSRTNLIERIKKENGFKDVKGAYLELAKALDTNIFNGSWSALKASKLNKPVFKLSNKIYTQTDFAQFLEKNQAKQNKIDYKLYLERNYKTFVDQKLIEFEDAQLEKKYPDFSALMQEYRDGILLFDHTDKKVWSKAVEDTIGLKKFFENNRSKYMWPKRVESVLYTCKDAKTQSDFEKAIKNNKKKLPISQLAANINKTSELNIKIENLLVAEGENKIVDNAQKTLGPQKITIDNANFYYLDIIKLRASEPKALNECRGLVTADYQNVLETEWIEGLKKNMKVEVNRDLLKLIQ